MNLRTVALALALCGLAAFVLLNWPAFVAETALSLGFIQVQAPLGLVMLCVCAAISGLFIVYIVLQQASVIVQTRRWEKELRSQRGLADQAEASRFSALREFLTGEFGRIRAERTESTDRLVARLDQIERRAREQADEESRSMAAHLGEIEDKLDRALRRD